MRWMLLIKSAIPLGDADPSKSTIAETSKLIGNSVYGHAIMRKDKHSNVQLVDLEKAEKLINDPKMSSFEELPGDTFEVQYDHWSMKIIIAMLVSSLCN